MSRKVLLTLTLALAGVPGAADTVYLTNGGVFEDVATEQAEGEVRIRMPYGDITLPAASILRIDQGPSQAGEYLSRRATLRADHGASAADWLELALWARANGVPDGVREGARKAAELDPALPALAPVLRGLGYAWDEDLQGWLAYEDLMRRRGFVEMDGSWITREQVEALAREREAASASVAARAQADRAARAMDLAELLLVREAIEVEPQPPAVAYGGWVPGAVVAVPGWWGWHHAPPHTGPSFPPPFRSENRGFPSLLLRQPGSFLPIQPQNHGSLARPGGTSAPKP